MFTTGFAIFLGLLFIMAKLKRKLMLRLLHYDVLVDMVVTMLVLYLHWGSFASEKQQLSTARSNTCCKLTC